MVFKIATYFRTETNLKSEYERSLCYQIFHEIYQEVVGNVTDNTDFPESIYCDEQLFLVIFTGLQRAGNSSQWAANGPKILPRAGPGLGREMSAHCHL
jgi:hypothetical protein